MAYSQAQNKATQKYSAKAYDQIKIVVKKGNREKYNQHAKNCGQSLNALIVDLLEQDIKEKSGAMAAAVVVGKLDRA